MKGRLKQQLDFLREIDKLKAIFRKTKLFDGSRFENDAEHSWTLAVMVVLLREYADFEVNLERTLLMVLMHDVVEVDAGDVFIYDAARADAHAKEEVAAARASYGAIVMAKINAAKFYPAAARSSGVTGIVGVQFNIDALGKVISAHVIRSSGHDLLDQAALDILRSLDLPPPPAGSFSANTNIKFTLMR